MREKYTVVELCEAFTLSSSGYYKWRVAPTGARRQKNQQLVEQIRDIHADRHMRCYGSPRMTAELKERGLACSENRIARLMKQNDLRARRVRSFRPKTTQRDPEAMPAPNRLAKADKPTQPGRILISDITYVATRQGWLYLAVVIDLFSRCVVGWKLADSMATELVTGAIQSATDRIYIPRGALFHSDRGCQFTSQQMRLFLAKLGVTQSMSAQGYCYDNAACESFFATLKKECFPQNAVFESKQQARMAIFDYLETFYNRRRKHSSIGNLSPEVFLKKHFQNQHQNLN